MRNQIGGIFDNDNFRKAYEKLSADRKEKLDEFHRDIYNSDYLTSLFENGAVGNDLLITDNKIILQMKQTACERFAYELCPDNLIKEYRKDPEFMDAWATKNTMSKNINEFYQFIIKYFQ